MNSVWKTLAVGIALTLTGCAGSTSGNVYSRERAQKIQTVEYGQVLEVRQVQIEGTKSPVGPLAGGALGGALGSGIGRGSGTTIGVVGGAIAGVLAGGAAEEALTKQSGLEITVRMDSGQTLSLVQGVDPPVRAGDRVKLMRSPDGSARVIPVAPGEAEEDLPPYAPR
jgi:outer membrane lipoprotein SlyB